MLFKSKKWEIEAWVERLIEKERFSKVAHEAGEMIADGGDEHKADHKKGERAFEEIETYLECEEGQAFAVRFRCLRPGADHQDLQILMTVDGRKVAGLAWLSGRSDADIGRMYISHDNGQDSEADLSFAPLPKTDDEREVDVHGLAISKLCRIEVEIRQGECTYEGLDLPITTDLSVGKVHEKASKLGSTILGTNLRSYEPSKMYTFQEDRKGGKLCRLTWKYHTKDQLGIRGIIEEEAFQGAIEVLQPQQPQAASSITQHADATGVKREREVDDGDDLIEEVKRVKKEKTGPGSQKQPIVVPEFGPFKRSRRTGGKAIIDLTSE